MIWSLGQRHDDYYVHADGRVWPRLSTVLANYHPFNPPPQIPAHVLEEAANLGTNAHAAIAMRYGNPIPDDLPEISERSVERAANATEGWVTWQEVYEAQPIGVELTLDHPELCYVTTIDLVAMIRGRRWVIDWKTSTKLDALRGVAQLAGMGAAWEAHHPTEPIDRYAIVRLDKDDPGRFEMAVWNDVTAAFEVVSHLAAIQWAEWAEPQIEGGQR